MITKLRGTAILIDVMIAAVRVPSQRCVPQDLAPPYPENDEEEYR